MLWVHGIQDAAFIYSLAQEVNAQVSLAVGLFVCLCSELSDAEHVFLYAGDSCPKGISAPSSLLKKTGIPTF